MVRPGVDVFLRVPDRPPDEGLHRASVRVVHRGVVTVETDDAAVMPGPGGLVFVYCERDGMFVRQAALVGAVTDDLMELQLRGAVVSAERRRKPRVSYLHVLQQVVREPLALTAR